MAYTNLHFHADDVLTPKEQGIIRERIAKRIGGPVVCAVSIGISPPIPRYSEERYERNVAIARMFAEGKTKYFIANYFGIDRSTVRHVLKHWTPEGPKGVGKRVAQFPISTAQADGRTLSVVNRFTCPGCKLAFTITAVLPAMDQGSRSRQALTQKGKEE